jgi:ADP-ribose pyrophosphatase YjhB (NUDIX family)
METLKLISRVKDDIIVDGKVLHTKRMDIEVWCLPGSELEAEATLTQAAAREAGKVDVY